MADAKAEPTHGARRRALIAAINEAIAKQGHDDSQIVGEALLAALYSWTDHFTRGHIGLGKAE